MTGGPGPRVCVAMLLHNDARHLREAIEALLGQTYRAFTLAVLDDGSSDDTPRIVAEYAARDARIVAAANPSRQGYCASYRRVFAMAPPGIEYFAWAAGHDRHAPTWLERMVATLDADPDAVVAYPLTVRISDTGEAYDVPSPRFETAGLDRAGRIRALATRGFGFGNIIYGLFRASAIRRAGVLRDVLLPDTVLAWEVSLHGTIRQVPEPLWFRRYVGLFSLARQRRNGFVRPPWYTYLPPAVANSAVLLWSAAMAPGAGPVRARAAGATLALRFFLTYGVVVPLGERAARVAPLRRLYRAIRRRGRSDEEA
jgi:glycosyltransferase involved in cell wall biosynthesis